MADEGPRPPDCSPPVTPRPPEQGEKRAEVVGNFTPEGTPVPPPGRPRSLSDDWSIHTSLPPERLEKYVPDLPVLKIANVDASSVFSDWLTEASPIISSLSPGANEWWRRVVAQSEEAYERWLAASPTQRLHMVPDSEGKEYRCGKCSLLEQRIVTMVLKAFPEAIKQEALNARTVSTTALLFRAFCKIQPGSALDKRAMITYVSPPTAQEVISALESYRKWVRVCRRLTQVRAQLPDPSLRLNGVDAIGKTVLLALQGTSFRVQTWREQNKVDYLPTHEKVDQLVQLLIAELELTSSHAPVETPQPKAPKNPKLARVEDPQPTEGAPQGTPVPKSSPKGQPKGGKEGKGGKGKTPKGSGKSEDSVPPPSSQSSSKDTPMCKGYLTAKGCAYGDQCRMQHDFSSAGRQSLCYACGSLENRHRRPDCPTVTNPKGSSKGKGKTKGKPKVDATTVENSGPQITEVSESSVDPSHDVASVQAASAQGKASASSAVEQEALKILKGLRLACLTVDCSTLSACPALRSSAGQGGTPPGVSSLDSSASSGLLRAMGTASDPAMQGLSLTPFVGAFSVEYSVGLSCEDTSLHGGEGSKDPLGNMEDKGVSVDPCSFVDVCGSPDEVVSNRVEPKGPSGGPEIVPDGSQECSQVGKGGSVEGDCVWNVSVSEGIVDSGASCVCRWAEVEEYRKASLQRVDLPLGAVEMRVAVTGSVLTLDTRPTILPMGQLVHFLGIQVVWDCFGVQMWHPREGFLDVRVQEGRRVIVGARDTGLLVQELECAIELSALVQAWDGPPIMNVLDSQEDQAGIAVSLRYVKPEENLLGLVDGGATNALRTGTDQEIQNANWINVELAAGKTRLAINEHGTLLAASEVTPIVPLGAVISQLRCELSWDQQGVTLEHPVRGRLPVTLVKGCPMLPRALVLELILELEGSEAKNRVRSKAMSLLKHEEPLGQTFQELIERSQADQEAEAVACLAFAKQLFPSAPHDLLKKAPPLSVLSSDQPPTSATTGLNRRIRRRLSKASSILVHLFWGVQSWKLGKGQVVLEIEESRGLDLLNDELFSFLVKLVLEGKVRGIIAGPPCTTFSRARSRSPGPRVLRARYGSSRFGLPGLTSIEKAQLERDNLLILRMLYLIHVAQEVTIQGCFVAIEHPRDPSLLDGSVRDAGLPSLWEWPEMTSLNLFSAQVDQGRLGHDHVKPTTVYANSWSLYEGLHNIVVAPKDRLMTAG